MGSFADSILKNTIQIKQEINDKILDIAVSGFRDVVAGTPHEAVGSPYSKGLMINQWYPSNKSLSSQITSSVDDIGADSYQRIYDLIGQKYFLGTDSTLSLTNNVDYAYRAEALGWPKGTEGQHWQGATPYAMVAKALVKMKAKAG